MSPSSPGGAHRRMRCTPLWLLVAMALASTAFVLGAPGTAAACANSGNNHCESYADFFAPSAHYTGALSTLSVSRFPMPSSGNFSTGEMWVCDVYTFDVCNTWIEAGFHIGARYNQTGT